MAPPRGFPKAHSAKRSVKLIAPGISAHPRVLGGKPVIAGTRIPVALLIAQVAGGVTPAEVAIAYGIAESDVRAALAYVAKLADSASPAATA